MVEIRYEDYHGLVIYIAKSILSSEGDSRPNTLHNRSDLIQVGWTALLEAARRFEPERGVPFGAYAAIYIRWNMLDALVNSGPTTRAMRDQLRDIQRATEQLEQKLGRVPSEYEVSSALDISIERLRLVLQGAVHLVSIEDEADKFSIQSTPECDLLDRERRQIVQACLDALPKDLKRIVILRAIDEWTLKEISRLIDRSVPAIHRIQKRAYEFLKRCLQSKGWAVSDHI
jgi:RNA polymerase sigma factor for flagellar operon FliA